MSDGPSDASFATESGGLDMIRARKPLSPVSGSGAALIAAERRRQIDQEDWQDYHDDQEHVGGELARAAACYADVAADQAGHPKPTKYRYPKPRRWPWEAEWWKPKDQVANLVRAGALIAAEIDRLQRAKRKDS